MDIQSGDGGSVSRGPQVDGRGEKIERFHIPLDSLKRMFEVPAAQHTWGKKEKEKENGLESIRHAPCWPSPGNPSRTPAFQDTGASVSSA